jgi:hypothetical protein
MKTVPALYLKYALSMPGEVSYHRKFRLKPPGRTADQRVLKGEGIWSEKTKKKFIAIYSLKF